MPPARTSPAAHLTTSSPPPHGVNFGRYPPRRAVTSPMRSGSDSRTLSLAQAPHSDGFTTAVKTGRMGKRARVSPVADATSSPACSSSPSPSSRAAHSASTSACTPAASPPPVYGGAASPLMMNCGTGRTSAPPCAASSHSHTRCLPSGAEWSASISFVEERVRRLVHPVGVASLLPAPLQRILANVLRTLQQERAQLKGQRPCRRPSRSVGTGIDAEVTGCMVDAAQAPSLVAAADMFSSFLSAHPTDDCTLLSSPVVLVGTALAELVTLGQIEVCITPMPQLLSFLDAAISVGHAGAMHAVAVCLREGTAGLQRDLKSSEAWLRCAAASGYLPAMHELGEIYECDAPASSKLPAEASDDAADWGEAMQWYRQAAEAGYPPSQLNLGKLLLVATEHAQSEGSATATQVAHLLTEAKRWLRACAATGVEEAVRLVKRIEEQGGR
ncbi:hypothetical protein, conserved [Leishmania tarentolae]|uniref:Sel1 repeat family protein n=1 Tax=Leishmania tarentolae TaxID=5689 RepID=A0A640KAT6_LEITA|nr:hypothetical protein, conserved [Leishmania tarentolae]